MTRMGLEIELSLLQFEGTPDEARFSNLSVHEVEKQKHSRLMSDILWSMTNYLRFHLGDDLVLGSARQYGSYWDIPGGDVKVQI